MKSKLRNQIGLLVLTLFICPYQGSSQYSSYPAYSTVPQESSGGSGSVVNSVSDSSKHKAVDLTTNGVGDGSSISEQNQRSHQTVGGYQPQGSQNMFYYEMYPAAGTKPQQRCTYTGSGMKCQYRRESAVGGQDSYTAAAHSAPSASYGTPMQMQEYGHQNTYGVMDEEEEKGEGGGLGALAGLIGLLGLKGLKGLKPLAFLLPFLPILLPLLPVILLPILLLPLLPLLLILGPLILFLPIPVIVDGRNLEGPLGRSANLTSIARIARDVIESEECIERISCEIGRMSRKYNASKWLERLTDKLPKTNRYTKRVVKGLEKNDDKADSSKEARGNNLDGNCSRFVCKPRAILAQSIAK